MWAANRPLRRSAHGRPPRQRGGAAVEFALLVALFLILVFGIFEMARLVYLFNTLQEVTRRAASLAINSPFDAASQDSLRKRALIGGKDGNLLLGAPVTFRHLRLEYLSLSRESPTTLALRTVTTLPADPARNRLNCLANPSADNCIRFVRVSICQPGAEGCGAVPYRMLFPLVHFSGLNLPHSETIAPAQTMGYTAGSVPGA